MMRALLVLGILAAAVGCVTCQELLFRYRPRWAAGVGGQIRVRYEPSQRHPSQAVITADLDVSDVAANALRRLGDRCPQNVTEFEWNIHTNWTAPHSSGAYRECSPREAGNHYDPGAACGPNSEYAGTMICTSRSPEKYRCTPSRYRDDPSVCEQGDLSGKLGNLVVGRNRRVHARFVDPYFPANSTVSPTWNIILHPVCGRARPRFVCAVVKTNESDD